MTSITIVGLGPGDPRDRTIAAQEALETSPRVILRTAVHPGVAEIAARQSTTNCDDLYASAESFEGLYHAIAARVVSEAASSGELVYAVPGSPSFGERTVQLVREQALQAAIPVQVLAGVSCLDLSAAALGIDLMRDEVQILDGASFVAWQEREPYAGAWLEPGVTRPLFVAQVYNPAVATAIKLTLGRVYPDEHPVILLRGSEEAMSSETIPLHRLDHVSLDHLSSLYVPPLESTGAWRSAAMLARVVAHLRSPDGCPWDREQTFASLRGKLLEEAYEAADAIDDDDMQGLPGELGDLLLLVALQSQIGEEQGTFTIEDVYERVNRKLVRRHPHVFGGETAQTAEEVVQTWQRVKAAERREALSTSDDTRHPFDRLPRSMPALGKIRILRAAELGQHSDEEAATLGDRLLQIVEEAYASGYDPEAALERAYRRRYLPSAADSAVDVAADRSSELTSNREAL